ncbi:MAG TPA: NAD-dependent deacylase [Vicinamibacterales bacterium]|nr:NAD-dependent deacylase [Vicinamibacterales bacterium]
MVAIPAYLRARLRDAKSVTVLTGAGVSAASGVPTFRGPAGLWRRFRPEDLATPDAFARDPRLVWEWYAWRRERIACCQPNAAHVALAEWSRRYPRWTLITQNVDGLHERAGTAGVLRFHGSIWELSCWDRCGAAPWADDRVPLPEMPPRCPSCGGLARPAVVWFGEPIDPGVFARCAKALTCDLFFVVGTSSVVYPAAGLTEAAAARGAFTVEINPDATEASDRVDLSLRAPAEEVLPLL